MIYPEYMDVFIKEVIATHISTAKGLSPLAFDAHVAGGMSEIAAADLVVGVSLNEILATPMKEGDYAKL